MSESTDIIEADGSALSGHDNYAESVTESYCSDTTSVSESVLHYQFENGRRYHASAPLRDVERKYPLPNDEAEQDRLDLAHSYWLLLMRNQLCRAPLPRDRPICILDAGTGTGIWANDVADQYPNATVTGVDISPIQPVWVGENVRFEVDDLEQEWNFSTPFDLVHTRNMVGGIRDWPKFIKQSYEHLCPGGYLEMHETDLEDCYSDDSTVHESHPMRRILKLNIEAGYKLGLDFTICKDLKAMAEAAGFEVTQTVYKAPFSPWAKDPRIKELGKFALSLFESGLEAYSLALMTRVMGMTVQECRQLFDDCLKELRRKQTHPYGRQYLIVCRKPYA